MCPRMKTESMPDKKRGRTRRVWKKRGGFTLIELLIVVAIIGIVAGIAIPSFVRARNKTKISRVFADFRIIGEALETYAVDNIGYPSENASLDELTSNYMPTRPMIPFLELPTGTTPMLLQTLWEEPGFLSLMDRMGMQMLQSRT